MGRRALAILVLACLLVLLATLAGARSAAAQEEGEEEEVPIRTLEVLVHDFDGNPLIGASVEALNATDADRELINSTQTNSTGWATLWVPNGTTCDIEVIWRDALVGSLEGILVNRNMTVGPITCSVCDLIVRTVAEDGRPIIRARVTFNGNYTTRYGNYTTFKETLFTNASGICVLEHALMECNYTLQATRHGLTEPFGELRLWKLNETTTVNITCPFLIVKVSVVDEQLRPLTGAKVEAIDWGTGELVSSSVVDERGMASLKVLFGRNIIRALEDGWEVGRQVVDVVENNTWCLLPCRVLNLTLSIKVLDALGNPLPGLEVRLLSENGTLLATAGTGASGQVSFTGLRPGYYIIEVLSGGEVLARQGLNLARSMRIEVRVGDRALLLGTLVSLPEILASSVIIITVLATLLAIWLWGRVAKGKKTL